MTREEAIKIIKECKEKGFKYTFYTVEEYHTALDMAIKALEQEPCEDAISRTDMLDAIGHGTTYTSEELQRIIQTLSLVHSQPNKEDIHREREQAYMRGYEDGSRKYRTAQSEDAISRQVVEKITWEEPSYSDALNVLTEVRDKVRALPPVNPQLKTGHWIEEIDDYGKVTGWHCDKCYEDSGFTTDCKWDFCPNCGTKMVEPQETETWNGYHGQITAPKGTFERIFNDADDDNEI